MIQKQNRTEPRDYLVIFVRQQPEEKSPGCFYIVTLIICTLAVLLRTIHVINKPQDHRADLSTGCIATGIDHCSVCFTGNHS